MTPTTIGHPWRAITRHASWILMGAAGVLMAISLGLYGREAAAARQPRTTGLSLHSTLTADYGAQARLAGTPLPIQPASLSLIADALRDVEPSADVAGRMATLTTRLQTPVPSITPNQQTAVAAFAATPTSPTATPGVSTPTPAATQTATPAVATATATPPAAATATATPTATRTATPAAATATATPSLTPTHTATPGLSTATATVAPACAAGPVTMAGNTLTVDLVNGPNSALITRLTVEWVRAPSSQKLRTITLAGAPLMTNVDTAPPTILPDERPWAGTEADRTFGPNAVRTLALEFQDPLAAGLYRVTAEFNSGCTATAAN